MESLIGTIDVTQEVGIFHVPVSHELELFKSRFRRLNKPSKGVYNVPFVIRGETYLRQGLEKRFNLSYPTIRKLCNLGLIRPLVGAEFTNSRLRYEVVSPLSIAQTLSWLLNMRIEKIFVSEDIFKTKSFCDLSPRKRIRLLFRAYRGCDWLERFISKQKNNSSFLKNKKINLEEKISRHELVDWFILGYQRRVCQNLLKKGFILPNAAEFKSKSMYNFIDNEAFAELIAQILGVNFNDLICSGSDDYLESLAEEFIVNRLKPHLLALKIIPLRRYSLKECQQKLRIPWSSLSKAKKNGCLKKEGDLEILGVDLAIYGIKYEYGGIKSYSYFDLLCLFGATQVAFNKLGMRISAKGTFSRVHYVFPVYDRVAEIAKKKILEEIKKEESLPLGVGFNGRITRIVYFDALAKAAFCTAFRLDSFEEINLEYLQAQLMAPKEIDGNKITTEDLLISTEPCNLRSKDLRISSFNLRGT